MDTIKNETKFFYQESFNGALRTNNVNDAKNIIAELQQDELYEGLVNDLERILNSYLKEQQR